MDLGGDPYFIEKFVFNVVEIEEIHLIKDFLIRGKMKIALSLQEEPTRSFQYIYVKKELNSRLLKDNINNNDQSECSHDSELEKQRNGNASLLIS